jgi:hypothetical protein
MMRESDAVDFRSDNGFRMASKAEDESDGLCGDVLWARWLLLEARWQ